MTNGVKLRVLTHRSSHEITANPMTKAISVAMIVGPHETLASLPILRAS